MMMLTRRSFLGALTAVVAAPRMLARLRSRALRYEECPLSITDVMTAGAINDGPVVTLWRDQHGRPYYASIHAPRLIVNNIGERA